MHSSGKTPPCPVCGESVRAEWNICPVCETRLRTPVCPLCGISVEERWKRCPECETRLICPSCGRRTPQGQNGCPHCESALSPPAEAPGEAFVEKVCGIVFLHVPGGVFTMGDTFGQGKADETPPHRVQLDSFYMARFPVTQGQWRRLMGENPAKFPGEDRPVEQVNWEDVNTFLQRLEAANPGPWTFALPTEAQWEFAARGRGGQTLYAGGDHISELAWYEENSGDRTHPVGRKFPNALGIYDMSGNVWEWCRDTYQQDAYRHHASRNPLIAAEGRERVIRGGAWNLDAWSARCTRRFGFPAEYSGAGLGFRPVMTPAA